MSAYALQTQDLVKRFGGITATDHAQPQTRPAHPQSTAQTHPP